MISYSLFENVLTANENDYAARVQLTGSADLEALMARMIKYAGNLDEGTIRSVMLAMESAIKDMLLEGYRVNIGGLCDLYPRITGHFDGAADHFDPARHRVEVGASPDAGLRGQVAEEAKVHKVEASKPAPLPLEFVDTGSGEHNGTITQGNIGTINGARLRFDEGKSDEGVFLVPVRAGAKAGEKTEAEARVEAREIRIAHLQRNKPGQLVFLNPTGLNKGLYHLAVRARLREGADLREGQLDGVLTV